MDDESDSLEGLLGHKFLQPELLQQSLVHSSMARSRSARMLSNERMEFLGDRVLGLVIADLLFKRFPEEEEGTLARRHVALVRRESLASVARTIGLAKYMVMSRGEEESGGRHNPAILADTCEAVIAALYLDGGITAAGNFIRRYWMPLLLEDPEPPKDAKTALQEWAQKRGLELPVYLEIARDGPAHAPVFTVKASVTGLGAKAATGTSKRAAEQAAAAALLLKADAEQSVPLK
jgi:ribonuclease-3